MRAEKKEKSYTKEQIEFCQISHEKLYKPEDNGNDIFRMLKEKKYQLRIPYTAIISTRK